MLLTLDTSSMLSISDRLASQPQAAGWIHAQTWAIDRQPRGRVEPKMRPSGRSKYPAEAAKEDMPPPVPPKDYRGSPASSAAPPTRRRAPPPLQQMAARQPQSNIQPTYLTVRGQPDSSYNYQQGAYGASVEPTSAPSTRTEFADAVASTPTWHRASELSMPQDGAATRITTYDRCVSPIESLRVAASLRRSVSSYGAADYSPSVYSPTVNSPPSATDISRVSTLRSQATTWMGPSPISPPEARERWAHQNSYPPARAERRSGRTMSPTEEPFEDASQFHLFAEATAGLGPLVDQGFGPKQPRNIVSPVATRGTLLPRQDQSYLTHGTSAPRAVSVPPSLLPHEFYAPRVASSMHRRQTHSHGRSREAQELSEAFAEALTGFGPEGEVGPEDELPDYAQSQREAQQRQGRAAAQRAQELEQRWAKARRAAQMKGR